MTQVLQYKLDERWVTIGGSAGEGGEHEGGQPVKIDGSGKVLAGPQWLADKGITDFGKPGPDHETGGSQSRPAGGSASLGPGVKQLPDGRVTGPATLDLDQLATNPGKFQYKIEGIGTDGVTESLKDVRKFRPEFAGQLAVWRDPEDGKNYVINGHHRYELAKRTGYDGQLSVYFIDAKNWKEARAQGALANMAAGHGTALDAASFMRDTGLTSEDLAAEGVSLKGKVASDGAVLAKLSDSIFKRIAGGVESTNRGLAIAKHVDDHKLQDDLYNEVQQAEQRGRSLTDGAIEEMAREVASVPTHTETHRDLFGDFEETRSLRPERAILKSGLRKSLSSRAKAFTEVSRRGRDETLAEAGNVLNTEQNKQLAQESNEWLFAFDKLANTKGEVSDAINNAAQQLAAEPRRQKQILDELVRFVTPALNTAYAGRSEASDGGREGYARASGGVGVQRYGRTMSLGDAVRVAYQRNQLRRLVAANVLERLKYAQDGDGKWVTIGGSPGEKGQHEGGQPVKIDSSGKVLAGPKWLADKGIKSFGEPGPDHETEAKPAETPKAAPKAKGTAPAPSPQEQLDRLKKTDAILRDKSMSPRGKLKPLLDLGYSRGEAMAFFDPYHGTPDGIPAETMAAAEKAAGAPKAFANFDEFAAHHGVSRAGMGDAGLHRSSNRFTPKQWNRKVKAQVAKDAEWQKKRDELRKVYDEQLASGEIRQKTRREKLDIAAAGHPDNESTQAARRVLASQFGVDPSTWAEHDQRKGYAAGLFDEKDHPRDPMGLFVEADQSWRNLPKKHKSLHGQQSLFDEIDVTSHEEKVDRQKSAQKTLFSAKQQLYAAVVARLKYRKWDESKHPRDDEGKFTPIDGDFHKTNGSTGGGLGLARHEMPQIKGEDKPAFFSWLERRKVPFRDAKKSAASLKPSQSDLNQDKVDHMVGELKSGTYAKGTPPIVSSDGYVLDGHHRWAAMKQHAPDEEFDVVVVDKTIHDLLDLVREFPKSFKVSREGEQSKYSLADAVRARVRYALSQWDESKHPRASDGRFGSKPGQHGGGTATNAKPTAKPQAKPAPQPLEQQLATIAQRYGAVNPTAPEGHLRYKDANGNYTPQRAALHNQIVAKALSGAVKPPAGVQPQVVFMGGGPAAGKSSIVESGMVSLPQGHALVDPDAIKGHLPEYQAQVAGGDQGAAGFNHEESSDLGKRTMAEAVGRGLHTVLDTTGDSSYESLAKKVAQARASGHAVNAEYVTVNTEEAVRRAMARAKRTGRMVSESTIRDIHRAVSQIVPQAIQNGLFDNCNVWDTEVGPGEKPVLVASAKGNQLQVHHPERWQKFLAKGNE